MNTIPHEFNVGDPVSYAFNGDCYPAGYVAKITKKFLTTTTNQKFSLHVYESREKVVEADGFVDYVPALREGFRSVGGTWALVKGHHYEQNPHF